MGQRRRLKEIKQNIVQNNNERITLKFVGHNYSSTEGTFTALNSAIRTQHYIRKEEIMQINNIKHPFEMERQEFELKPILKKKHELGEIMLPSHGSLIYSFCNQFSVVWVEV